MRKISFLFTILLSIAVELSVQQDVYVYIETQIEKSQKNSNQKVKETVKIPIYKNNQLNQVFNYTSKGEIMCSPNPSVTELSSIDHRTFFIENLDKENTIFVQFSVYDYDRKIVYPNLDLQSDKNSYQIKPLTIEKIQLAYNCNYQQQMSKYDEAWSRIYIKIDIFDYNITSKAQEKSGQNLEQLNPSKQQKTIQFSMMKICQISSSKFDFSIFLLMVLACIIVGEGSKLREKLPVLTIQDEQVNEELTTKHAIGFVLIGSCFLMLLYFFMPYLKYVLFCCVLMSSFSSGSIMIYDGLYYIFENYNTCINPNIRIFSQKLNKLNIASMGLSLTLVLAYSFTRNFMLSNIIALFLVLLMLKIIVIPSLKIATLLLSLAFFYDIFWVFISPYFFNGNSVMATVATNVKLPMMFQCPYFKPYPEPRCSLIGLGDLVLPGIFVSFCYSFQKSVQTKVYHTVCWVGYCVGLFLCMVCLVFMGMAQPALLYLTPCTIIPVCITAVKRKEFNLIWNGLHSHEQKQNLSDQDQQIDTEIRSGPHRQLEMVNS